MAGGNGTNKQLKVAVKIDTKSATQSLDKLMSKIRQINDFINKNTEGRGLDEKLNRAAIAEEKLVRAQELAAKAKKDNAAAAQRLMATEARRHAAEVKANQDVLIAHERRQAAEHRTAAAAARRQIAEEKANRELNKGKDTLVQKGAKWLADLRKSNSVLSSIYGKLRSIAATYLGIMGGRALLNTSDTITKAKNKLNYNNSQTLGSAGTTSMGTISPTALKMTEKTMDKMYTSAQKVSMSYTDMMSNVAKSMTLASDAFGGNIDNAIRFQEIMSESYTLGGASIAEQNSSMYQLIQALGSGQLAGDELRSVREGAPLAYKEIEKFCQGVLQTEESLKELASEGMITSDMVVAAIMQSGDEIDKAYQQSYMTFEQFWQKIKNTAVKVFEPIADKLREALAVAVDTGILEKIESILVSVGNALYRILITGLKTINWLVDNWNWLRHVIAAALILWASVMLVLEIAAVYAAYSYIKAWMKANGVTIKNILSLLKMAAIFLVIIAAILAIVYVVMLWRNGMISGTAAICIMLAIIGVAALLVCLLIGGIPALIIGAIIAGVAFLLIVIVMFLQWILAVLFACASIVYNILRTMLMFIIKWVIGNLLLAWDNFANFFGNLFNDPVSAIIRVFRDLGNYVLSLLGTIANGIDSIFGSNLSETVNNWQKKFVRTIDLGIALTSNGKYETKSNASEKFLKWVDNMDKEATFSVSDSWNVGKDIGDGFHDWLNGLGGKSGNNNKTKTGLDVDSDLNTWLTDITNPTGENTLEEIADDTGSINDTISLAEEDLKYLRALADREWKREYTTATIQVDMSNYNTVNGDGDLDGICTKLADKLYEEMSGLANGVY